MDAKSAGASCLNPRFSSTPTMIVDILGVDGTSKPSAGRAKNVAVTPKNPLRGDSSSGGLVWLWGRLMGSQEH